MTGVVTLVVLVTKFMRGAYIVIIAVVCSSAVFYTVQQPLPTGGTVPRAAEPRASWQRLGEVAVSTPADYGCRFSFRGSTS